MKQSGPMQTMEQKRARYALARIEEFARLDKTWQEGICRCANQLPALIHMNGLGQALAFYKSKGKDGGYAELYALIGRWLCTEADGKVFANAQGGDALGAITQASMQEYMRAQGEAQALLEWVKKFAMALLKHEQDTRD